MKERRNTQQIFKLNKKYDCGLISGYVKDEPIEKNKAANKKLYSLLSRAGYQIFKCLGVYDGEEESFFVVDVKNTGVLKAALKHLGQKFNQDCVIFSPRGGDGAISIKTTYQPEKKDEKGEVIQREIFPNEETDKANGTSYNTKADNYYTAVDKHRKPGKPTRDGEKSHNFSFDLNFSSYKKRDKAPSKLPEARQIALEGYKAGLRWALLNAHK